jgi:hypothetical protein
MNTRHVRTGLSLVFVMLLGACVAGCGDKDAKWYGTYKNKEGATLTLQAEHKGTLDMSGTKAEVTWETTGDDKIAVHAGIPISMFRNSDGSLRDEEGTVWKKT